MMDKCKLDGGTCGIGGYCNKCPYNQERQADAMNARIKREEENSVTCDCLDSEGNPHEECCLCAGTGFAQLNDKAI